MNFTHNGGKTLFHFIWRGNKFLPSNFESRLHDKTCRQKINLCKGGISLKSRDMGGIDYAVRNWGAIECRKGGMVINTQKWGVTHLRMKAA